MIEVGLRVVVAAVEALGTSDGVLSCGALILSGEDPFRMLSSLSFWLVVFMIIITKKVFFCCSKQKKFEHLFFEKLTNLR